MDISLADLHDLLKRVQGFSYYFCFMIRIREAQKQTAPTEDTDLHDLLKRVHGRGGVGQALSALPRQECARQMLSTTCSNKKK